MDAGLARDAAGAAAEGSPRPGIEARVGVRVDDGEVVPPGGIGRELARGEGDVDEDPAVVVEAEWLPLLALVFSLRF